MYVEGGTFGNSVVLHAQHSCDMFPMDGAMVGAESHNPNKVWEFDVKSITIDNTVEQ
jgi:hypothetical protein